MRSFALIAAAAAFAAGPASAYVLGGGIEKQVGQGGFVKLDPKDGFAVGADTFDDDNLYAFDENQNILLERDIRVDVAAPEIAEDGGVIRAGQVVASHYVFFDSIDGVHIGYVDFDAPILGVAAFQGTMGATDFLADTDVTYLNPELRGLERGDYVWIDPEDPHRLRVFWAGSSPGDFVRVFTARSPGV
ncbi:MAG: hypothetical protein AAGF90_19210 [Pseudomonadota bacterium]